MVSPIEVFLVFDLETTGLNPEKNAIIEIACCPFDIHLKDLPEFKENADAASADAAFVGSCSGAQLVV